MILQSITVATILLLLPSTAHASPVDEAIVQALDEHPGGVQTAWNEVSWDDGDVTLTIAPRSLLATFSSFGRCDRGAFCIFSGYGGVGKKVTYRSCGTYSTSVLGQPVRSIVNSRSGNTVRGKNGSTIVVTVGPSGARNVYSPINTVECR